MGAEIWFSVSKYSSKGTLWKLAMNWISYLGSTIAAKTCTIYPVHRYLWSSNERMEQPSYYAPKKSIPIPQKQKQCTRISPSPLLMIPYSKYSIIAFQQKRKRIIVDIHLLFLLYGINQFLYPSNNTHSCNANLLAASQPRNSCIFNQMN